MVLPLFPEIDLLTCLNLQKYFRAETLMRRNYEKEDGREKGNLRYRCNDRLLG